ncbi:hypothetical protein Tco_0937427, partial [Tanacetum coccineum]
FLATIALAIELLESEFGFFRVERGALARMIRLHGHMLKNMRKSFVHKNRCERLLKILIEAFIRCRYPRNRAELSFKVTKDLDANVAQQNVDFAVWIALKYKFEKSSTQVYSSRPDVFRRQYHDDHYDNDAHPEGENSTKRQKTSKKIVWESRAEDLTLQVPNNPALVYQGCDRTLNAPTRQEFMKEIIVNRIDGYMCSFLESDYKNLNKHDSEDLSLIKKIMINTCKGSNQLKVNLIAPTLTIPCIEDLSPCSIISIPFVGLIYKSSKKERRVMNTDEIPKFCDATLERVLKNGKKISLDVKHSFKDPPFNKEDSESKEIPYMGKKVQASVESIEFK